MNFGFSYRNFCLRKTAGEKGPTIEFFFSNISSKITFPAFIFPREFHILVENVNICDK